MISIVIAIRSIAVELQAAALPAFRAASVSERVVACGAKALRRL